MSKVLLKAEHLKKYFKSPHGTVKAVDDVSLEIYEVRRWRWWVSPAAASPPWGG